MKAIVWTKYGSPDGLQLQEVVKPTPKDNEVLVKIHATTITAGDSEMRRLKLPLMLGFPMRLYAGLLKPTRIPILGQELAGEVVGYSHWQYIEEEILIPLDLNNTYTSIDDVDMDDVMSGYWVGYEPDLKHDPHGSMLATAEDVGIFVRALNDGSLLNDNEQAIYSSIYEYGHSGLIPGYQSIARYHSDIDTVVVQFVNTAGGTPIVPAFDTRGGTKVMVSKIVYNRIVQILSK